MVWWVYIRFLFSYLRDVAAHLRYRLLKAIPSVLANCEWMAVRGWR